MTVSVPRSYVALPAAPVSIAVILDPWTTIVALRRVLPVPSSTVAAWMRMVAGVCEEIVADAARTNTANATAADLMGANYNRLARIMLKSFVAAGVALAVGAFAGLQGRSSSQAGERRLEPWPVYGGDAGG